MFSYRVVHHYQSQKNKTLQHNNYSVCATCRIVHCEKRDGFCVKGGKGRHTPTMYDIVIKMLIKFSLTKATCTISRGKTLNGYLYLSKGVCVQGGGGAVTPPVHSTEA